MEFIGKKVSNRTKIIFKIVFRKGCINFKKKNKILRGVALLGNLYNELYPVEDRGVETVAENSSGFERKCTRGKSTKQIARLYIYIYCMFYSEKQNKNL